MKDYIDTDVVKKALNSKYGFGGDYHMRRDNIALLDMAIANLEWTEVTDIKVTFADGEVKKYTLREILRGEDEIGLMHIKSVRYNEVEVWEEWRS